MTYPPNTNITIPTKKAPTTKAEQAAKRKAEAYARGTVIIKLIAVDTVVAQMEEVFAHESMAIEHLRKMRRWLIECWQSTGSPRHVRKVHPDGSVEWIPWGRATKPLAVPIRRRADKETAVMDEVRLSVIGQLTDIDAWAAWMIAIDALLQDVEVLWEPAKGERCWVYLPMTWETMTRLFLKGCDDQGRAEERGAEMYERIVGRLAWA